MSARSFVDAAGTAEKQKLLAEFDVVSADLLSMSTWQFASVKIGIASWFLKLMNSILP
jgi:hypothetical protein